eukprot:4327522-Prymnesium_polylepis.1
MNQTRPDPWSKVARIEAAAAVQAAVGVHNGQNRRTPRRARCRASSASTAVGRPEASSEID